VNGRKFVGSNGGAVFVPAAGIHWDSDLDDAGSYGYYWSSTLNESDSYGAYVLYFNSSFAYCGSDLRYFGHSVRPVR
jgi:hypothetical protein